MCLYPPDVATDPTLPKHLEAKVSGDELQIRVLLDNTTNVSVTNM